MQKTCEACGDPFEAKRPSRKTCGERCRKRMQRQPSAEVVRLHASGQPGQQSLAGSLTAATQRGLTDADRLDTELGQAAMLLARRLDDVGPGETGAGMAALVKEYRATLADALKDSDRKAEGTVDEIRTAALRLIEGLGA